MKSLKFIGATTVGLALLVATAAPPRALAAEKTPEGAAKKVTFEDDVKSILRQHCQTCHNQSDKRGGLALDSYGAVLEGGGSGEVVFDDGDLDGSRLWQLVNHDDTPVMPPEQPKLPAEQLAVIKAWIEGGILEDSGSKAKVKKKNALAFVAPTTGRPEGPPPMPQALPQTVPVVTERASAVTAIGASPWAPLVAVAGQKQIVLYHGESGDLLGVLPFEEGIAQSLRFSRDGKYLIAGGGEHSVLGIAAVYEIEKGTRVATVGDDLDVVFDADCNDTLSRIAMGGPQRMLRIFDASDGTLVHDLKKHTDWIYAVAFSPDGVLVASADRSGGLVVWEAETGRLFLDLTDHKGAVNSLSWRDDSNVLASASDDGTVKLWDMVQGKAVKSINVNGGAVMAVRFDHKGQLVTASKDRKVRLWDAAGSQIKEFPATPEATLQVAITHDSSHVAYGDWSGMVQLASIADPPVLTPLAANPPPVEERLKAMEQTLASIRTQLEPLAKAQQDAKAAMAAAEQKLADAEAALKASMAAAEQSKASEAMLLGEAQQQREKLAALVTASQAQHEKIVADRAALGDSFDAAKVEALAAAETQLAAAITELAQHRRTAMDAANKAEAEKKRAAELSAKVKPAEDLVAQSRANIDAMKAALEKATQAHDDVASQMSEQEQKKQALAAAVQ